LKEGTFKAGDSGEPPVVPGHASQSRLIQLVSSDNGDEQKDDGVRFPTLTKRLAASSAGWHFPMSKGKARKSYGQPSMGNWIAEA
jgi:hypothetical protein